MKDFLYQCFQKDPNLRISAKKLAKHPWMVAVQRQVDSTMESASHGKSSNAARPNSQISASPYKPKILIPKRRQINRAATGSSISESNTAASSTANNSASNQGDAIQPLESMAKRPLTTVYDQAIQRVQEWNAALNGKLSRSQTFFISHIEYRPSAAPKPPLKTVRRKANLHGDLVPSGLRGSHSLEVGQSSSGSLEAHLKAIADQPQAIWKRNLMDGRDGSSANAGPVKENQEGNVWDDDFAGSPDLAKFVQGKPTSLLLRACTV